MTATTEFFWPAGIQRPPFRHGLITSNIVSNIVNYSAILLTLLQAILNQVLPPSFSVSTSVVFLTGKTARQPYLAALLRPRAYGPHWRHGRSHSHGNPRGRCRVVGTHMRIRTGVLTCTCTRVHTRIHTMCCSHAYMAAILAFCLYD